jgi:uncharacterized protein (DUF305 family)
VVSEEVVMRSWWTPVAVVGSLLALVLAVVALVVAVTDDDRGPGPMMSSLVGADDGTGRRAGPGPGGMPHGTTDRQGMGGAMPGFPGMHGLAATVEDEHAWLVTMVAHHEEAVAAARELERSDRAEMRELGRSIVAGQTAQVAQMRTWLERWYDDRGGEDDRADGYAPMMRDLSDLSGDELDRAFLTDMVPHHMVAVMMSQQLLARGLAEHEQVADLAVRIRDEQHAEIATMRRWLWAWFG